MEMSNALLIACCRDVLATGCQRHRTPLGGWEIVGCPDVLRCKEGKSPDILMLVYQRTPNIALTLQLKVIILLHIKQHNKYN